MPEAVIVSAARSPIGRANKGSLKDFRPDDLTATIIQAALAKVPELDPSTSTTLPRLRAARRRVGQQHGPGRQRPAWATTTCPAPRSPATARPRVQTTRMAFHAIKAGEGDAFISAGVETVSRFAKGTSDHWPDTHNPLFDDAEGAHRRVRPGRQDWHDPREDDKVPDVYIAMGQTAENVARLRGLDRKELDEFGVRSQNLAEKAIADGFWAREITPVTAPDGTVVSADDGPRAGVTYDGVPRNSSRYSVHGVVTAGNCCGLNDGAAAVIIMSDTKAAELGITPSHESSPPASAACRPNHGPRPLGRPSARWPTPA